MFVNDLFEKEKAPRRGQEPRQSETEFGYRKLDPLIHKARQKYPLANDDTEALALYIADKEEADVQNLDSKVSSVNKNAQTLIQRQQQVLQKQNKELDAIEQELDATKGDNQRQEKDIEQLVKGVNDANARYAAQEERFRDLTARVAAQKLTQTDIDAANIAKELEKGDDARAKTFGAQQIVRNDVNEQGVAEGLPQTLRKIVPGYAKREIDKKMDAQKFGRTDVDKDANYYRYKKIQDKLKGQGVAEDTNNSPVAGAITRRIVLQRADLLAKYGPEKVGAAIDEVADFVGDVDEIGSSDVSGWVKHVEQMLGNMSNHNVTESTDAEIEKHLMEMRHAGYDINEFAK